MAIPPFESITFAGREPGIRLIVTGAVHGNETCGTVGIRRVVEEIRSGALEIKAGKVTFVPIANPLAYSKRERMGDREEAELLYSHATSSADAAGDAYFARALLRNALQRRKEAVLDLGEAVAISPRPERLRLLGSWYVEASLWPAALAVYRTLLADAEASGDEAAERDARLTVTALSWLASDSDPVLSGISSPDWARRSLARAARPRKREPQGVRKLTP